MDLYDAIVKGNINWGKCVPLPSTAMSLLKSVCVTSLSLSLSLSLSVSHSQ